MRRFLFLGAFAGFLISQDAYAESILVPSDSKASYEALSVKKLDNNQVKIVTKRIGSSGESYSKRLVDCNSMTFKYLGDGDTLDEMEASKPSPNMSELVSGSISDVVSRYACSKVSK
ncbi:MAG: hypothetical protein WBK55_02425 [Alphaproteobacteria bacterium]